MTDLNPAALNPAAHVIPETEDEKRRYQQADQRRRVRMGT